MITSHTSRLGTRLCLAPAALGLAALGLVASTSAHAAPAYSVSDVDPSIHEAIVETHGIDLASAAGQALVASRIEHAVRDVCGLYEGSVSPLSSAYIDCHSDATANARAQLRMLVARAASRTQMASK